MRFTTRAASVTTTPSDCASSSSVVMDAGPAMSGMPSGTTPKSSGSFSGSAADCTSGNSCLSGVCAVKLAKDLILKPDGKLRGRYSGKDAGALLLDHARLEHLRTMQDDSQPSLVRELIDLFIADSPAHMRNLWTSFGGRDASGLRASTYATANSSPPRRAATVS